MENSSWIPVFKAHFSDKEILNPNYLISLLGSRKNCKICGSFTGSTDEHIEVHARELEEWDTRRKAEAEKKKKEQRQEREQAKASLPTLTDPDFYALPCEVCGMGIKRSGKRGRPPTKHKECKV